MKTKCTTGTMGVYLLAVMAAVARTTAANDAGSEYLQAAANTQWSAAHQVLVQNPAAVDDTLAVVVAVAGGQAAFVVVDESGRLLVTQADDLDGNGTLDEVCFLLPVKANQHRTVMLLSAEAELPAASSDLRVKEHLAASWAPIRVQPSRSAGPQQHSTYLSPANAARTRKLMARLDEPVSMEIIECDDFRVLIGHDSGLIEAMRPANIPRGLLGSYLREFLPDEEKLGPMARRFAGSIRCSFQWGAGKDVRRITIYRNGVIESTWAKAPSEVQIIACAYPYQYLQTGPQDLVRYSQLLEMRRDLPDVAALGFFGRADASLRVEGQGLQAIDHQVWLDSGEIGWEVGVDTYLKKSPEEAVDRLTRYLSDTYIGGGLHVTSWKGGGADAELRYRIGNLGVSAFEAGTGLVRVSAKSLDGPVPMVQQPEVKPALSVTFEKTAMTVNRLYPSEINGWELRPVTLAKHNPQPAYFPAELINRSESDTQVEFHLEDVNWIHSATILSQRKVLTDSRFPNVKVPYFYSEMDLVPGGQAISIAVPAGETVPIEVFVRPAKGKLGRLKCRLHWSGGGAVNLEVLVRPTILYMPMFAPLDELGREFSNVGGPEGAPLSYGVRFWGGYTAKLRLWYKAAHRNAERKGFWTWDPVHIRGLVEEHGAAVKAGEPGINLTQWSEKILGAMRDPDWVNYRVRVRMHDEIHGAVGRKGHYVVPLAWLIDADRRIVMNNPTAAWPSFQEGAIDEEFQYQVTLPNDISELFYYCGQDTRLQEYARKLVEPRRELFEKWCADPLLMALAGTEKPRQIVAYWISTQLHVARYTSVRRQIWWLRHHGIDAINSWACSSGYRPYDDRIMHWMLMHLKSATLPGGHGRVLTDRALAWMDMKADMDLVTLVRLLSDEVDDKTTLENLQAITRQALDASQQNDFEAARDGYIRALKLLRPDLIYLAPRDLYRGPVEVESLPDLFADDTDFVAAQKLPRISVSPFKKDSRRPTVDGILDDSYIEQGVFLEMHDNTQGRKPKAATDIYLARDEQNLYVFFRCHEPKMAQLRTDRKERDSSVWTDAHVEILVDRSGDKRKSGHIIINSAGVSYDTRKDLGKEWNPEFDVVGLRGAESWTVEMKIPFESLGGALQPSETWRMNFCRRRYIEGEFQAWSVTFGAFDTPERFGFVQFN